MRFLSLKELVATYIRDGQTLAMEGFTHLIPYACGHEIIRQGRRDLHLVRMTPDLIYDQLIGAGCARALTFSWGGNPGVGSLHRLRDAVENGWPGPLELHEHSHAGMAAAYTAGAARLPFGMLKGYLGTDLDGVNPQIQHVLCPYTGERLATVPAMNPDITVLHAQKADRHGNILLEGIIGAQKEAGLAAKALLVTVEERVEELDAAMNAVVIPGFAVTAVAVVPGGAHPSYAHGYYARDNAFCRAWDDIARKRESFLAWIDAHVRGTGGHAQFLESLEEAQRHDR